MKRTRGFETRNRWRPVVWFVCLFWFSTGWTADCRRVVSITEELRISVEHGWQISLEAVPEAGEGYIQFTRRFTGSDKAWQEIRRLNGTSSLQRGRFYRVPLEMLSPQLRLVSLLGAFPDDRLENESWIHRVLCGRSRSKGESYEHLAFWYTGSRDRGEEIARQTGHADGPETGDEIIIPFEWLRDELKAWATDRSAAKFPLEYGGDRFGAHAIYRLKQGEALYSSVVVRFTGLVEADEVNELALLIAQRSGIKDVTDIPTGYGIKIPIEYLSPEYLPPDNPKRLAYEMNRLISSGFRNPSRSGGLAGVTVILDSGHGGIDAGASHYGVWEDDYCYDIACRVKRLIEDRFGGRVIMTLQDRSSGYSVIDRQKLERDTDEEIMVSPPYALNGSGATTVGVNLRWALANHHFRNQVASGVDPNKIVFTSFHADALHSSLRGAMIYIMGWEYGRSRISLSGAAYGSREECRGAMPLTYRRSDRIRSEGLSRDLAEIVLETFRDHDLPVHGYRPIRDHIIRNRKEYAPAVLKNNIIPLKLLLEVCNLRNKKDSRLLADPDFRQNLAEAYVEALSRYYRENGKGGTA